MQQSVPAQSQPQVQPRVQARPEPMARVSEPETPVAPQQSPLVAKLLKKAEELRQLDESVNEVQPAPVVDTTIEEAVVAPEAAPAEVQPQADIQEAVESPISDAEAEMARKMGVDLSTDQSTTAAVNTTAVNEAEFLSYLEWLDNGRPAWGQERFECLLFSVSGLKLAVPLVALGNIHNITDDLTPLFGQADWFMGLLPTPLGKVRVVNTAKLVMPEKYNPEFEKSANFAISIHGLPWALAVDSVTQPITLLPEEVKWRTERSKRAWLGGTVVEHMCALLDVYALGKQLLESDSNRTA